MHGVMESESDDEFFDAEDGFKEKRYTLLFQFHDQLF